MQVPIAAFVLCMCEGEQRERERDRKKKSERERDKEKGRARQQEAPHCPVGNHISHIRIRIRRRIDINSINVRPGQAQAQV